MNSETGICVPSRSWKIITPIWATSAAATESTSGAVRVDDSSREQKRPHQAPITR